MMNDDAVINRLLATVNKAYTTRRLVALLEKPEISQVEADRALTGIGCRYRLLGDEPEESQREFLEVVGDQVVNRLCDLIPEEYGASVYRECLPKAREYFIRALPEQ